MFKKLQAIRENKSRLFVSPDNFTQTRSSFSFHAASLAAGCVLLFAAVYSFGFPLSFPAAQAREGIAIPAPKTAILEPASRQTAIFAGGCFWGIEGVFERVKGVSRVESGYAGGSKATATYEQTGTGQTGHAEAVRILYDPKIISYTELMQIFFSVAHNPTQLNRQGPDSGPQYRSAIFPITAAQNKAAKAYLAQLSVNSPWGKKPVTKLETGTFYPAETYHQDFMAKNPNHSYIRAWDAPKVANLKRLFPGRYR